MAIEIFLAEHHTLVREGTRALLERFEDFEIVGEAANGEEAVQATVELKPDIVLTAITMPKCNGIEAAREIRSSCPSARIVALTRHCEGELVGEMLQAGALGYVLKTCSSDRLANAIRTVYAGQTFLCPVVAGLIANGYLNNSPSTEPKPYTKLTPREHEIFQLLVDGQSPKQIAYRLSRTTKTIEMHRRNIMNKLGIDSLVELTKYAIRNGITSLDD